MMPEHSLAVLNSDLPQEGLRSGDVGTVVFVHNAGSAYEVEFARGDGGTIAVLTLDAADVRPLSGEELLHARKRD